MPYSDNLYSALDEESDVEPIGEASGQQGDGGLGVTPWQAPLDTGSEDTHADDEAGPSRDAVDAEDPQLFSPTDGYFGTGMVTDTSPGTAMPTSSNVPYVPNVLVEDPSLQRSGAEGKAREAQLERTRNGQGFPNPEEEDTSTYPSRTAPAFRNGPSFAHPMSPTQQSTAPSSQPGATYYAPSSSTRIPPTATPSSYTTYSPQRSAYRGEAFPFLPSEAPPAYTPSPTSPSHPQGLGGASRNYSTFSQTGDATVNMGRPEETQSLLAHQPQSMRDHNPDGLGDGSATWRGRLKSAQQYANWRSCKGALIFLLLLLVTAGFLTSVLSGTEGQTEHRNPATGKPRTKPGQPNMEYPEIDGDFGWDTALYCKDAQIHRHKQTYAVDFDTDKQLVLVERTSSDDGRRGWGEVHTQGAVVFRRSGSGTPESAVTLEVTVTDDRLTVYSSWDAEAGALQVIVPHRVEWAQDRPRACVNVKVTIWVPPSASLKRLSVDAVHLDIKLLDNLSLSVAEGSRLTSTVGTITSASTGSTADDNDNNNNNNLLLNTTTTDPFPEPPSSFNFHSRIIDVRTTSAPITGTWPLYDYLGLQSTAGSVKVAVAPQPADPDVPKPAILSLKSMSGDVDVREPVHAALADHSHKDKRAALLPPRDYRVDVHTTSGDIAGVLAFSSSAALKSTSGAVRVEVLPVLDVSLAEPGARQVELSTASTSGGTDVVVLGPLWAEGEGYVDDGGDGDGDDGDGAGDGRKKGDGGYSVFAVSGGDKDKDQDGEKKKGKRMLRCLQSTHSTTSAHIKLRYPASWEGDINMSSLTGVLQVGGEGVKLIRAGGEWPGVNKKLVARKGEKGAGGNVLAKSTSGDLDVYVGQK